MRRWIRGWLRGYGRIDDYLAQCFRQDVLVATDMEENAKSASDDDDFEARVVFRKAKGDLTKGELDGGKRGKSVKVKGGPNT